MRIIIFLLLISSFSNIAKAKPLISGLGQDEVLIDARFSGKKFFYLEHEIWLVK